MDVRGVASPTLQPAAEPVVGRMDRPVRRPAWAPTGWPLPARIGVAIAIIVVVLMVALRLVAGAGVRTLRVSLQQVTLATGERCVFHDLIPLRAHVVAL